MLERVRGWLQSTATQILIAFLTVIFMVYFGMPQQSCSGGAQRAQRNQLLASVGGTSIYTNDLNMLYNRVFGGNNQQQSEGQIVQRKVRALRAMVLMYLFADRARDMGLRVSDEEFQNYIKDPNRNMEFRFFYGRSGEWNGPYYKAYVQNQLRVTIPEYERFKRQELLARKYLTMHSSQVAVPPHELRHDYEIANTKLNLEYVAFDRESLEQGISLEDSEVESFMEKHADDIESYYQENKEKKYTEPERVQVRRIFIPKPGKSADDSKRQEVQSTWKEAQRRVLDEGETLGDVAADLNPSFSAKKKGLMEMTAIDNLDQDIAKAIEGKDAGATEKIVTDHAYMIVKLEDRKPARETPLSEVRGEIARTLMRQNRVGGLIESSSKKLHETARSTGSLSKALDQLESKDRSSDGSSEFDASIWSNLSVEETGEFSLEGRNVPAQLQGRLSGMNLGGSWANIPKIGTNESLAATAYKTLSEDNPVPEQVYEIEGTKYVVALKSRTSPSKDESPGIKDILKQRSEKLSELLGQWNGIFQMPQKSYGPWIEKQLEAAVDNEEVKIYNESSNSKVAQAFADSFKPAGDAEAPKGAGLKGLQKKINIDKGQSGGGGKSIKLNPKGGGKGEGGNTIKLNPKGGEKGEGGNTIKLNPGGSKSKGSTNSPSGNSESSSGNSPSGGSESGESSSNKESSSGE